MGFADYMKSREKKSLKNVQEGFSEKEKKDYTDARFWYPKRNKSGNATAIIRFLPGAQNDDLPWIRYYNHSYKNPETERWFIANCPTSLGEQCIVCAANQELWQTGDPELRAIVSNKEDSQASRKRRENYVSNVLILSDPETPENEGKVFLFRYGKKIHDKLKEAADGIPEADEPGFDACDLIEGANFKLIIRKKDGQTNYDSSKFDVPAPLFGVDPTDAEELQERLAPVFEAQYSLHDYLHNTNGDGLEWLTPEEMQKKLDWAMGTVQKESNEEAKAEPKKSKKASAKATSEDVESVPPSDAPIAGEDEFARLALGEK